MGDVVDDVPLLFISHRQDDKPIADALRVWIESATAGGVNVFQSESGESDHVVGEILNPALVEILRKSGIVILIYTTPDRDWSYCMFECGIAFNGSEHATRVVVFQMASIAPSAFRSEVCVDVTKLESVVQFVTALLSNPDFFPGRSRAVTRHVPQSHSVMEKAMELHARLRAFSHRGVREFTTHPFVRLSMDLVEWAFIESAESDEEQLKVAKERVRNAEVIEREGGVERILGATDVRDRRFGELVDLWQREKLDTDPSWYDGLCRQIMRGDRAPLIRWDLMRSADEADTTLYAPAVMRVRQDATPGRPSRQFDVYFCRFKLDHSGALHLGVDLGVQKSGSSTWTHSEVDSVWKGNVPKVVPTTGPQ